MIPKYIIYKCPGSDIQTQGAQDAFGKGQDHRI